MQQRPWDRCIKAAAHIRESVAILNSLILPLFIFCNNDIEIYVIKRILQLYFQPDFEREISTWLHLYSEIGREGTLMDNFAHIFFFAHVVGCPTAINVDFNLHVYNRDSAVKILWRTTSYLSKLKDSLKYNLGPKNLPQPKPEIDIVHSDQKKNRKL